MYSRCATALGTAAFLFGCAAPHDTGSADVLTTASSGTTGTSSTAVPINTAVSSSAATSSTGPSNGPAAPNSSGSSAGATTDAAVPTGSGGPNPSPGTTGDSATSSAVSGSSHSGETLSSETQPEDTSAGETALTDATGETASEPSSTDGESSMPGDPNTPLTIWIAGDSTVANGNTPCPTGWGKHLAALFNSSTTVRNSAAGGRSVRTWMYNVTTEMGPDGECVLQKDAQGNPTLQARWQEMLDNMRTGDALLIQFGINDGSATCDRHVGLAAFKSTYAVLAAAAIERGAQPVFITPTSSIACDGATPRGTRGGYVDATLEIGAELGVPVLDLHARSVERYAELGFCPVAGGDVNASTGGAVGDYFCDDHTHFSSTGAADMAALVVELLQESGVAFLSHLGAP